MTALSFEVVIPTLGRASLRTLLDALAVADGPRPRRVLVVEDGDALWSHELPDWVELIRGHGRGPAAARNAGWRRGDADWVAFLDDDVIPERRWFAALAPDLDLPENVAGTQGRVSVPVSAGRPSTDWERNVQRLEGARWATADMAYRRSVLEEVGGFDERFPRAYREDSDLALRVLAAGYELVEGERRVEHPPGPSSFWTSVSLQRGNGDDVLMRALHGRGWERKAGAHRGRRPLHLAITAAGVAAVVAALRGKQVGALVAAIAWIAGTVELVWRRRAPGELVRTVVTSAAIPPAATFHWLLGWLRLPRRLRNRVRERPDAVLLDRDGTLIHDVPYNGDPSRVAALPGARAALDRLRERGVGIAVISNQSGVGRGLITADQVDAVNRRVEELVGAIDAWFYCPHRPDEGCDCRKPLPGLVVRAAGELGVEPDRCAIVGDIGSDVDAGRAVGARAVLVPTSRTRREEIAAAPEVARDLNAAVDLLLGEAR